MTSIYLIVVSENGLYGAGNDVQIRCVLLWWHLAEEIKIFKDEVELQKRKLAVRCGFCARGECRFGEDCKRAKRVEETIASGWCCR